MKVSCLMVTQESRWHHFLRSCNCFLQQTWPEKELVVAAHGSAAFLDYLERYCAQLPAPTVTALTQTPCTLGELRNLSVQAATGEIICQWDDDDSYHARRIELQAGELIKQAADMCLLTDYWHCFRDTGELYWLDCSRCATGKSWKTPTNGTLPGSLTARRQAMFPYPASARGEDTFFLMYALIRRCKFALLSGMGWCYVYNYHGANTWVRPHHEMRVREGCKVFSNVEIEALVQQTRATIDSTFSLNQVLADYDLQCVLAVDRPGQKPSAVLKKIR